MSGPDYPRVDPNSNAIGSLAIGVAPTGDIPQFDVWRTVISQYANSDILMGIILSAFAALDQTKNLDAFYDDIWNVLTARGYGLDVWGRIVGVIRILKIEIGTYFGFMESTDDVGFDQESFYDGAHLTENYELTDDAFRLLILAKAAANITDGSIPAINQILMSLFPHRGNAYVVEGDATIDFFGFQEMVNAVGFDQAPFYDGQPIPHMVMSYTFDFPLSAVELAIVQQSGVLPKPTGVLATVVQGF